MSVTDVVVDLGKYRQGIEDALPDDLRKWFWAELAEDVQCALPTPQARATQLAEQLPPDMLELWILCGESFLRAQK